VYGFCDSIDDSTLLFPGASIKILLKVQSDIDTETAIANVGERKLSSSEQYVIFVMLGNKFLAFLYWVGC